jgi:hypothetical protein
LNEQSWNSVGLLAALSFSGQKARHVICGKCSQSYTGSITPFGVEQKANIIITLVKTRKSSLRFGDTNEMQKESVLL